MVSSVATTETPNLEVKLEVNKIKFHDVHTLIEGQLNEFLLFLSWMVVSKLTMATIT